MIFVILSSDISIFLFNLTMFQIDSDKSSEDIYFLIFSSVICLFLIIFFFWCCSSFFFKEFFNYFLFWVYHFIFSLFVVVFNNFIIFCVFLFQPHKKNKICIFFSSFFSVHVWFFFLKMRCTFSHFIKHSDALLSQTISFRRGSIKVVWHVFPYLMLKNLSVKTTCFVTITLFITRKNFLNCITLKKNISTHFQQIVHM